MLVDHERVTRNFPGGCGEAEVAAIYEVADGPIASAWFRMRGPRLA